jgi:hypothetical protein
MAIPQIPQSYYGDVPAGLERGQRYAGHPNELLRPVSIAGGLLTSQVTEGTMADITGIADVGLVIDGVHFLIPAATATGNAAFVAALNALALTGLMGIVFSIPSGSTLRVAFSDYVTHTVTSYSPGAADVTGITNTVAASNPVFVHLGRALVSDASQGGGPWAVKSAASYNPGSGYHFAGVMCRGEGSRHSDEQIRMLAYSEGVSQGVAPTMHGDMCQVGYFKGDLVSGVGAATRGNAVYFETATGANCGAFATAANGTSQVTRGDVVGGYVAGVAQVTRGDVVFNGTDLVGLAVDSLPNLTVASDTSDDITAAALRDAWNASAQHHAVAVATIDIAGAESYIILTFRDYAVHTVAAVSPATADVTGITNTTAAAAQTRFLAPGLRWGRSHASSSSVGYLEIGVQPNSPQL